MTTLHDVANTVREFPNMETPVVPSIASSAMLCELSISTWTGRKKDKRASEQVTATNRASAGVANVSKKLLGDCAELVAIQKFTANVRNIHYAMTMPWSDTGLRLLPTAQYFKYHEQMTALEHEYNSLVNTFLREYDNEIINAQLKLGDLFTPDEYPTADSLSYKFGFRLSYIPLPDAGDFRVDVGNEATDQLRTEYQSYYSTQLQNAMDDVWKRLYEKLSNMSEKLDYTDDNKKIFRDTLVSNVTDMVELLNVCNVTGDTQMSAMANKLDEALRGITPDALREDQHLRAETKRTVDDVIKSLPSLDF
jgi:hypothetical protein